MNECLFGWFLNNVNTMSFFPLTFYHHFNKYVSLFLQLLNYRVPQKIHLLKKPAFKKSNR